MFEQVTNKELDEPLPFVIIIDDMNDNAPTFTDPLQVTVLERSKAGGECARAETRGGPVLNPNEADRCRHVRGEAERHRQRPAGHEPRQDQIHAAGWPRPVFY